MVVLLPVLADVSVDECRAIIQIHPCNALVARVPVLLSVELLGCKSNPRIPSYFDPHPPDILGQEDTGVLEVGPTITLALRPSFNDLACPIVTPAFRFKGANRRTGARHRLEMSHRARPKIVKCETAPVFCKDASFASSDLQLPGPGRSGQAGDRPLSAFR